MPKDEVRPTLADLTRFRALGKQATAGPLKNVAGTIWINNTPICIARFYDDASLPDGTIEANTELFLALWNNRDALLDLALQGLRAQGLADAVALVPCDRAGCINSDCVILRDALAAFRKGERG